MQPKDIKKTYDALANEKYGGKYEYRRWRKDAPRRAAYEMTRSTIKRYTKNVRFQSCLEVGPGAGTWTKLFIARNPGAHFDLVDISGGMLAEAKHALHNRVQYFESDFLQYTSNTKYDFFFSSRAAEYISDKELFVKKIAALLKTNGTGMVITKTPHYTRNKLLGRKTPALHKDQIHSLVLVKLFQKHNFRNVHTYPVVVNFPLVRSLAINRVLYGIFSRHQLNTVSRFFAESYCIVFKK